MRLNKERKILATIMLVGLIALALDRLSGPGVSQPADTDAMAAVNRGGPSALTPAPPAVGPATMTPVAAPPSTAAHNPSKPTISLAQRIAQLYKANIATQRRGAPETRDPFRISPRWANSITRAADPGPAKREPFEHSHHLTAVVVAGRQSCAVIDGALIRLRQAVAGYRLVAVTQDMAVLERGDARVMLKLEAGHAAPTLPGDAR